MQSSGMAIWRNIALSVIALCAVLLTVIQVSDRLHSANQRSQAESLVVEACQLIDDDDPVAAQRLAAPAAIDDPRWLPWLTALESAAAIWNLNSMEPEEFAADKSQGLVADFYATSAFVQGVCDSLRPADQPD